MNAIEKQLQLQPNRRMSYIMTIAIVCFLLCWSVTTIHVENVSLNGIKIVYFAINNFKNFIEVYCFLFLSYDNLCNNNTIL